LWYTHVTNGHIDVTDDGVKLLKTDRHRDTSFILFASDALYGKCKNSTSLNFEKSSESHFIGQLDFCFSWSRQLELTLTTDSTSGKFDPLD